MTIQEHLLTASGGIGLVLATVVIVRSEAVAAALFKACEQALHGAQRHGELGGDVVGVGVLLRALKKAACGWGRAERAA